MQLTDCQLAALAHSAGRLGYCFYAEMGLGKTLMALTEMLTLQRVAGLDVGVVVCPNSFKGGWVKEVEKQGLSPRIACHIYEAAKHRKAVDFVRNGHAAHHLPLLIVNYEGVRLDKFQALVKEFTSHRIAYLACDESIRLKNNRSKQAKATFNMRPYFRYYRNLSGKPTTQGPHDLWSQLTLAGAIRMSWWGFRNRFCKLGGYMDKEVVGAKNTDELEAIVREYAFVAKKRDWLPTLPPKTFTTRRYELGPVLEQHYAEMAKNYVTWLRDNTTVSVDIALSKYEKLAQIQTGFIIHEDGRTESLVEADANPRIRLLLELLEDEVQGKLCVVYRHIHAGVMLRRALEEGGYAPLAIEGGLKPDRLEAIKEQFNLSPKHRVILLQADASKYGHTLVGTPDDPCSTMVFFENHYSLDTRTQIEDRIHRLGQVAENCLYIDLSGTDLDEKITDALQTKEGMYQAVFGALGIENTAQG